MKKPDEPSAPRFKEEQERLNTRLVEAVCHADEGAVEECLAKGADPNVPFHWRRTYGWGARIDAEPDPNQDSLVLFAAEKLLLGVLNVLLKHGAIIRDRAALNRVMEREVQRRYIENIHRARQGLSPYPIYLPPSDPES